MAAYRGILVDLSDKRNIVNFKIRDIGPGGACLYCDKPLAESVYRMSMLSDHVSLEMLAGTCKPVRVFIHSDPDQETRWGNGVAVVFPNCQQHPVV